MPPVSPTPPAACTHDLGPGTTVCLRCRQESRDAARSRQQRMFALAGVAAMGLLGVYVMGASAASAWRSSATKDTTHVASRASVVASSVNVGSDSSEQVDSSAVAAPITASAPTLIAPVAAPPAVASPVAAPPGVATARSQPPFALIVRHGRTDLPDSLIVVRGGDSVVVDFDTPMMRTRRRDKFERVVRQTLPLVYGARADSVLRAIPEGGIASGADLLTQLPKRGVHLKVAEGWTLDLWPETRPGEDGPLVVSYRARVTRDGALQ